MNHSSLLNFDHFTSYFWENLVSFFSFPPTSIILKEKNEKKNFKKKIQKACSQNFSLKILENYKKK